MTTCDGEPGESCGAGTFSGIDTRCEQKFAEHKLVPLHIEGDELVLGKLLFTPGVNPAEGSRPARLPRLPVASRHLHRLYEATELPAYRPVHKVTLLVVCVRTHSRHDRVRRAGACIVVVPDASLHNDVVVDCVLVEHVKHGGLSTKGSPDSRYRIGGWSVTIKQA